MTTSTGSLRSDLLDIPGIESAEIEGDVLTPAGVKVRLAPGADAAAVSEQVQRVLAAHGLSSELSEQDRAERILAAAPEPDEGDEEELGTVAELHGDDDHEDDDEESERSVEAESDVDAEAAIPARVVPSLLIESDDEPSATGLASIAVEEDRHGVSVVATSDEGVQVRRRAHADGAGLDEAVVDAVAALHAGGRDVPDIVHIGDQEIDGSAVLTVVLAGGDRRMAGSTIVEGGRPYAVGRATWAALSAR